MKRGNEQKYYAGWIEMYGGATKPKEVSINYLQWGQSNSNKKFTCGTIENT
jgi:hypothetical protein